MARATLDRKTKLTHPGRIRRFIAPAEINMFGRAINKPVSSDSKQIMKMFHRTLMAGFMGAALMIVRPLNAAEVKTYQVTGPVLELTATSITVQKGEEKWEIARSKETKITGDLKVGSKVTIYYHMVAEEVEVKAKEKDGKSKKKAA
jgi:hypothetical protein